MVSPSCPPARVCAFHLFLSPTPSSVIATFAVKLLLASVETNAPFLFQLQKVALWCCCLDTLAMFVWYFHDLVARGWKTLGTHAPCARITDRLPAIRLVLSFHPLVGLSRSTFLYVLFVRLYILPFILSILSLLRLYPCWSSPVLSGCLRCLGSDALAMHGRLKVRLSLLPVIRPDLCSPHFPCDGDCERVFGSGKGINPSDIDPPPPGASVLNSGPLF